MSAKKLDKSAYEPSWTEVILGAALSVVLGVALGIVLLVIKPLAPVREMPKEPVAGTIYYIQGSHDSAKARQAPAKRKAFAAGGSVTVTEDEINSFLPTPPPLWTAKKTEKKTEKKAAPAPAPKAGEKGTAPAAEQAVKVGGANFHIADGAVQLAIPVTLDLFGVVSQDATVLATGRFVKKDAGFAFEAEKLYLGSCPMQRVPFLAGFVASKFINTQQIPEDIAAAWPKLADVSVEGNALKLTMP